MKWDSMYPKSLVFFLLGRVVVCWIFLEFFCSQYVPVKFQMGFQHVPQSSQWFPQHFSNSTSLCPIRIGQSCLCLEWIFLYGGGSKDSEFFFGNGTIKEGHGKKLKIKKSELGRHSPTNWYESLYTLWHSKMEIVNNFE